MVPWEIHRQAMKSQNLLGQQALKMWSLNIREMKLREMKLVAQNWSELVFRFMFDIPHFNNFYYIYFDGWKYTFLSREWG